MISERFHFQVGSLDCLAVWDASDSRPIEFLTGDVSREQLARELRERGFSSKEVELGFNCLVVHSGDGPVLIDAGWGRSIPRMQGRLLQHLQAEGITAEEIQIVILTHCDRDHMGGIMSPEGQRVFPNARYFLSKDAWEWYQSEGNLSRMSEEISGFYRRIFPLMHGREELVEAETEILPGIRTLPAPGHRAGHMALVITSGEGQLLHMADAAAHPLLMEHPEWRWTADTLPEEALKTRRRLLERASQQQGLIFCAHFPFPGLGHITPFGDGWRWAPFES